MLHHHRGSLRWSNLVLSWKCNTAASFQPRLDRPLGRLPASIMTQHRQELYQCALMIHARCDVSSPVSFASRETCSLTR